MFLEKRYTTIDALNTAWETTFWSQKYSDFSEILPPRAVGRGTFLNPTQQLDWRRYSSNALVQYYIAERDLLRSITPDIPITTNLVIMGKQTKDRNYAEWTDELDFVSNDHYVFEGMRDELSFSASLSSGVARHEPWFLMEHSTSAVQWQRVNTPKIANEMIRDTITHLAHGADGLCFFQWRQSKAGAERYHSSMIPHAGAKSRQFKEICKLGAILKDLGEIKGSRKEKGDVAIIFDWESWWVAEQTSQPSTLIDYKKEALDWFTALLDAGLRADIIPSRDHHLLPDYPLVIAPMLHVAPDYLANSISSYVHGGGHFVTTYWSGICNQDVHVHLGGYPGAFRQLLGVTVEEFGPISEAVKLDDGTEGTIWSEPLDLEEGVELITRYVDGLYPGGPAVTRRSVGKGSATYVSTKITDLSKLISNLTQEAGVKSSLPEDLIGRVEQVYRIDGRTRWEFLVNRTNSEIAIDSKDLVYGTEGKLAPRGVAVYKRNA